MQLKQYLQKAYPYYYQNLRWLAVILFVISISSFLFSYLFEPFEVNLAEHKIDATWIMFTHAFLPLLIAFVYFFVLNKNVKDERSWTLGKELFHVSTVLLIIGIVNFLIRDIIYTNPDNWSLRYLWEEIRNTFLIGFLLLAIILPLNLERLFKKYDSSSKKLQLNSHEKSLDNETVLVKTAIESEQFMLRLEDFIFAKVEGNYIEIYTQSSNSYLKKIVRLTLKELEEQLRSFPVIYKTHRSFIINTNYIKSVSGNAQGYNITLKKCPEIIPVSRSKVSEFNALFPSSN